MSNGVYKEGQGGISTHFSFVAGEQHCFADPPESPV